MSAFITKLWEDIFTPGPTPTIVKATNASFAALQLVLALLLVATRSVHCVVLSALCAGLWASVNWFVVELRAAQDREREEKEKQRAREAAADKDKSKDKDGDADEDADEEEEDTEEEEETTSIVGVAPAVPAPKLHEADEADEAAATPEPLPIPALAAKASAGLEPVDARGEVKHRPGPGTQSSVSTEDEWEKVSEHDNEHDKDK